VSRLRTSADVLLSRSAKRRFGAADRVNAGHQTTRRRGTPEVCSSSLSCTHPPLWRVIPAHLWPRMSARWNCRSFLRLHRITKVPQCARHRLCPDVQHFKKETPFSEGTSADGRKRRPENKGKLLEIVRRLSTELAPRGQANRCFRCEWEPGAPASPRATWRSSHPPHARSSQRSHARQAIPRRFRFPGPLRPGSPRSTHAKMRPPRFLSRIAPMNRDPHVVPALAGRQRRSRLKAGLQTTPDRFFEQIGQFFGRWDQGGNPHPGKLREAVLDRQVRDELAAANWSQE